MAGCGGHGSNPECYIKSTVTPNTTNACVISALRANIGVEWTVLMSFLFNCLSLPGARAAVPDRLLRLVFRSSSRCSYCFRIRHRRTAVQLWRWSRLHSLSAAVSVEHRLCGMDLRPSVTRFNLSFFSSHFSLAPSAVLFQVPGHIIAFNQRSWSLLGCSSAV